MGQQAAIPPPAGQSSNFEHPKDVLHTINFVTQILCMIIVSIFVAIRVWIKSHYHKNINSEDYLTVAGWALFMGFCACMLILNKYGGGYNEWDVPAAEMVSFQKASYATTLIYVPMVFVIKLALLAVMGRVFAPHRRKAKVIYCSIIVFLCYYIPALFIKIFFCDPISAYWLGTADGGKCFDQRKVIIADSVISIVGDLWILVLPAPLMMDLQMNKAKKLRVIGILSAGGIALAFSIARLFIMVKQSNTTNTTWFWIHCVLTANAEAGIGLICACLPAMNRFFTAVKNLRSNPTDSGYVKSHEMGSWQKHSSRSAAHSATHKAPENAFLPNNNDQVHLISTAAGPENEGSISSLQSDLPPPARDGISKNVTVSQVVERRGESSREEEVFK